ncbi:ECF transporter S component [Desulfoferula mesophila]|uniref:Uncharacterized protein n=1 Tax=Desulfoferula mesophila TaxID=3058419 RepID=A0AAU9EA24_9BACT|nr:hypothetical protein FAK_10340 [Desulfoferula mesophilus]
MMIWQRFSLRDGLYLGFCGTFIVIARAALRMHLHLTGHSMFFNLFFLLLARGVVRRFGAATLAGVVAGLLCMFLGLGKDGPLLIVRYGLLGLIVDLGFALYPRLAYSYVACFVCGAAAALTRGLFLAVADLMAGMETAVMIQHVLLNSAMNMAFGAAGGLLVPPVIKRLQSSGLIA